MLGNESIFTLVVDMDLFVAFAVDLEPVLENQFRLFLPPFLQLMMEMAVTLHT